MKRRAFLAGSLAAPAVLSISDVLVALCKQAEPIPQGEPGPSAVRARTAKLYIDGHEIDRVLSIAANQHQDVIDFTSEGYFADSASGVRTIGRGLDYSTFQVDCHASQQAMIYVRKIGTGVGTAEFVADLDGCQFAFTGIITDTHISHDPYEPMVLSFTARATSPVITTQAA